MTEATGNRRISICIATHNEFDKVLESISKVIDDSRVEMFIIIDDHSDDEIWWRLEDWLEFDAPEGKIKLGQNEISVGTSITKQHCVIMADTEYVLILQPNKVLEKIDLDYIFQSEWSEDIQSQFLFGVFAHRAAWLANFEKEQKALG